MVTGAPARRHVPPAGSRRTREAGYNLVILAVAVTILSILVAGALPVWSTAMKREREEELIFRGLQYAEALRVFQQRFGRLPTRLEELIEVEPRCIRQLWTDPITGERDWRLIRGNMPVGMDGGSGGQGAGLDGDAPGSGLGGDEGEDEDGRRQGSGGELPQGDAGLGPIRGVRSRSTDEALKTFFDKDRYDQWLFTVDLLTGGAGGGAGNAPPGIIDVGGAGVPAPVGQVKLRAQWLGRPFRPGVSPGGGPPPGDHGLGAPSVMAPPQEPPPGDGG
jgi:type II secretory pathway pseudopilin PulG